MKTATATSDTTRHRLLEGVLLRLARRPDASDFVLRGGMLLRHWFRPIRRPAGDLDLIVNFPFDVAETARRILPVLSEPANDGVLFDVERGRVTAILLDTGSPGVRLFASGVAPTGGDADFHVDITFGPPPRPAPVFGEVPTACGEIAHVWMCRPETIVGQKLQALWHLGMLSWRPKDLDDLRLLLQRVPMDDHHLLTAITAYFADVGESGEAVRATFGPAAWWGMKMSSARWLDFVKSSRQQVPRSLAEVIAEVCGRLKPILEKVP